MISCMLPHTKEVAPHAALKSSLLHELCPLEDCETVRGCGDPGKSPEEFDDANLQPLRLQPLHLRTCPASLGLEGIFSGMINLQKRCVEEVEVEVSCRETF